MAPGMRQCFFSDMLRDDTKYFNVCSNRSSVAISLHDDRAKFDIFRSVDLKHFVAIHRVGTDPTTHPIVRFRVPVIVGTPKKEIFNFASRKNAIEISAFILFYSAPKIHGFSDRRRRLQCYDQIK